MRLVQHPAYEDARRRLRTALDDHRPGHMVFIIGPSGVGKTTLRHSVMQELFGNPYQWGRGRAPAVQVFATLPNRAYYSSKDMARNLVDELHAPRLDWLLKGSSLPRQTVLTIEAELEECRRVWNGIRPMRATEGEWWAMFERGLLARGCKYVSIDQVTALLKNHRDTSPADHTLHLMALAESAGVMCLMTGVHEAVRLWDVHSELRRRVTTVWAPPYSDTRPGDRIPFLRLLKFLGAREQLYRKDLLLRMASEVLAATGGVIGEVMQLLDRARKCATEDGSDRIAKRHIEASYYGDVELLSLWRDIEAFEYAMRAGSVQKRAALARMRWDKVPQETCKGVPAND